MRKYIIMGVQGSGKGTQAKLLAERLDLEHISVGDIFRWNVQHHTNYTKERPVRLTETIFAGDRNRLVYELGDLDALYERDQ
jgi:adenylate kinase family enzyme